MGGMEEDGTKRTPFVFTQAGEKTHFVIYCRRCHLGLCRDVEVGTVANIEGVIHNVVAVQPHVCGATIDWPESYLGALAEAT
jgi:hypothetical protein